MRERVNSPLNSQNEISTFCNYFRVFKANFNTILFMYVWKEMKATCLIVLAKIICVIQKSKNGKKNNRALGKKKESEKETNGKMKYLAKKLKCQVAVKTQASVYLFHYRASRYSNTQVRGINVHRYCVRLAQICGGLDIPVSRLREWKLHYKTKRRSWIIKLHL